MIRHDKVLLIAFPFAIALSLIEAVVLARRQPGGYDWKAMGVSLLDQIGRQILALWPLSLAAPVFALAWHYRIATVQLGTAWSLLLLFVGQELCYYWYHRTSHRVRWFWNTHQVHHSPNQLNLSAAYRFGITGRITGSQLFFAPMVWLGFEPRVAMAALSFNLLYQFWLHATWIPKLGWLEYVLNTPSAHRVHHAANVDYLDANYGGVLIVFDRLFGTYRAERADLPCRYGLVHPVTTHNVLKIELTPWWQLLRDLRSAHSAGEVLGYLFKPPGWKPDGKGETTEDLRLTVVRAD